MRGESGRARLPHFRDLTDGDSPSVVDDVAVFEMGTADTLLV